jgi:peptidoglycan-associated lipoprotein
MMNRVTGKVAALLLMSAIVAGCQTTKTEPPAPAPAPQPVAQPAPPPPPPPPPPKHDGPVDDSGNPVGNTVYFEYDSAVLAQSDVTLLGYHAKYLKDATGANVMVEGHCDERGTREYNLALGERRASSVKEVLTGDGVEASRLETVSYGEEKPVDPGHDESAWGKNRRAELVYRK